MGSRFAVYWAPATSSAWWQWGAHWLGRDETRDARLAQPDVPGWDADELFRITAQPRRYGLHATLKAPFHLAEGLSVQHVWQRLQALARAHSPISLGPLRVVEMDGFLALTCAREPAALQALAKSCVTELDDLRAPLSEAELVRRGHDRLDARGRELLQRYGYAQVLERFVWHVTLSDRIDAQRLGLLRAHVGASVARLNAQEPLQLDRLSLFVEPAPGATFLRLGDVTLTA